MNSADASSSSSGRRLQGETSFCSIFRETHSRCVFYEPAEPHLRTCKQRGIFAVQKLKIFESTPLDGHRYAHAATHTKCGDAAFGVGIFKKM